MIKVYPFASGSEYTASFAVSASFASIVASAGYVYTASNAGQVLLPVSGSPAAVNLCVISYNQYIEMLNNPGTTFEQCIFTPI